MRAIKKMEWIDASEHPPPFAHRVLLCDEYGYVATGIGMDDGKYWYSDGEEPGCKVTHWMELPDIPKELNG